ncbi:hypothetical protein [Streptomyces sp. NRRL B-24720]|uniref:hypothetical protein n=1 Tax=Streptomyces sp. NRRL B-24720 TaxID=1476876 RepID=UPI0004C697A8|nr:hypothetical protein [Streptomyces sp. NRRL B-24720]
MRFGTLLLIGTLAFSAVACGSGSDAKPSASPSATDNSDKFLDEVHAEHFDSWAETAPTDGEILMLPPEWCLELKDGHSVEYLLGESAAAYPNGPEWGTARPDANRLLVLGVTNYCPEYRDQVTKELRETGQY